MKRAALTWREIRFVQAWTGDVDSDRMRDLIYEREVDDWAARGYQPPEPFAQPMRPNTRIEPPAPPEPVVWLPEGGGCAVTGLVLALGCAFLAFLALVATTS